MSIAGAFPARQRRATIGHYTVGAKLRTDVLGEVYSAVQQTDGTQHELTLLHASLAVDRTYLSLLGTRVEQAAGVRSPRILCATELLQSGDAYYLACDAPPPTSMAALLRTRRSFPPREALTIALLVASALEPLSAAGINHDHLSPACLHIDQGALSISGVGTVWPRSRPDGTDAALLLRAAYAAPERLDAFGGDMSEGNSSVQADIYSLGVLLFRLLTGRLPFTGATPAAIGRLHAREPIPPLPPGLLGGTYTAIRRCLAKQPGGRYRSMTELVRDLRQMGGTADPPAGLIDRGEGIRVPDVGTPSPSRHDPPLQGEQKGTRRALVPPRRTVVLPAQGAEQAVARQTPGERAGRAADNGVVAQEKGVVPVAGAGQPNVAHPRGPVTSHQTADLSTGGNAAGDPDDTLSDRPSRDTSVVAQSRRTTDRDLTLSDGGEADVRVPSISPAQPDAAALFREQLWTALDQGDGVGAERLERQFAREYALASRLSPAIPLSQQVRVLHAATRAFGRGGGEAVQKLIMVLSPEPLNAPSYEGLNHLLDDLLDLIGRGGGQLVAYDEGDGSVDARLLATPAEMATFMTALQAALRTPGEAVRQQLIAIVSDELGPAGGILLKRLCSGCGFPFDYLCYGHLHALGQMLRDETVRYLGADDAGTLGRRVVALLGVHE